MDIETEYKINENIIIKYIFSYPDMLCSIEDTLNPTPINVSFDPIIKICIRGRWFDAIPLGTAYRTQSADGYYHFIYIQINTNTCEYYIGKVNRKRLSELKKYQGSGVKFKAKYKQHSEEFERFYISSCNTAKETELLEAEIVCEELLKDPFCLNLVIGGGGTNEHYDYDRRQKQSEYMKAHPEQYAALVRYVKDHSNDRDMIDRRNEKITETMSAEIYKDMTRDRMNKWRDEKPEEYKKAREKNKASIRTENTRKKKSDSAKAYIKNNPEEHRRNEEKRIQAATSPEARAKRSKSQKEWISEHPDEVKLRAQKSAIKNRKAVNMLEKNTDKVLKTFNSLNEAAEWLVDNGRAKSINCKTSISAVCLHKPCTTGYGYRKEAYGFSWEYVKN